MDVFGVSPRRFVREHASDEIMEMIALRELDAEDRELADIAGTFRSGA